MSALFRLLLAWVLLVPIASTSLLQPNDIEINTDIDIDVYPNTSLNTRSPIPASKGPTDFSWVENWAAIGDSFTAGIGAGSLYSKSPPDKQCSRYDDAYPALLERRLGPSVREFEYFACTGDRSFGIYLQALALRPKLDLVVLTAGGNDLCLTNIITTCILLPFQGEKVCQDLIDKAQENIDTILKPNIHDILLALNSKMKDDGIVVFPLYAQFFNTQTEDCGDKFDWSFPPLAVVKGLKLTIERRKKFNELVRNINAAIKQVVADFVRDPRIRYHIGYADWDVWSSEAVKGQFCEPGSARAYPDPKTPDLHFFRPTLKSRVSDHDELKKKGLVTRKTLNETEVQEDEISVYNTLLYKSINPAADALQALEPRSPKPPACPGDDKGSFGLGLPDRWGKWFHPNELGHKTIASFVMETIFGLRSQILKVDNPICKSFDQFACNTHYATNHRYLSADVLVKTVKTYCQEVIPRGGQHWEDECVFYPDTPDAHMFGIYARAGAAEYTEKECLEAFNRIIHGCDPRNPMNFKLGGRWYKGPFRYVLRPIGKIRPWPMIEKPYGKCEGNSDGNEISTYTLYGAGWASWDHGKETIYKTMSDCIGWELTSYKFEYFDRPDKDGYEWKMTTHWPEHVMKCFRNDKVQKEAGGSTGGCSGTD